MVLRPAGLDLGEGFKRSKHMLIQGKEQRHFLRVCYTNYTFTDHRHSDTHLPWNKRALSELSGPVDTRNYHKVALPATQ